MTALGQPQQPGVSADAGKPEAEQEQLTENSLRFIQGFLDVQKELQNPPPFAGASLHQQARKVPPRRCFAFRMAGAEMMQLAASRFSSEGGFSDVDDAEGQGRSLRKDQHKLTVASKASEANRSGSKQQHRDQRKDTASSKLLAAERSQSKVQQSDDRKETIASKVSLHNDERKDTGASRMPEAERSESKHPRRDQQSQTIVESEASRGSVGQESCTASEPWEDGSQPNMSRQQTQDSRKSTLGVDMMLLPDVFKRTIEMENQREIIVTSDFPLPRRSLKANLLGDTDDRHEAGVRLLREQDFEAAREGLEGAWAAMRQQLDDEAEKTEAMCRTPPNEIVDASDDQPDVADLRHLHEKRKSRHTLRKHRQVEQSKVKQQFTRNIGVDLCLVYSRLQYWDKVDEFSGLVLATFSPEGKYPSFGNNEETKREEEEFWAKVMVSRGVACTFLGAEHFLRARQYFLDVLHILPSHRNAKRGLDSLDFVEKKVLPAENYSAVFEALSRELAKS